MQFSNTKVVVVCELLLMRKNTCHRQALLSYLIHILLIDSSLEILSLSNNVLDNSVSQTENVYFGVKKKKIGLMLFIVLKISPSTINIL